MIISSHVLFFLIFFQSEVDKYNIANAMFILKYLYKQAAAEPNRKLGLFYRAFGRNHIFLKNTIDKTD